MDHGWSRSLHRCLAVFAGVLGAAAAPAGAAGLTPTADLGVSAATPTRNLGAATRLVVARAPAQRAFVRFALGAVAPPRTQFILNLYPLRSSRSGLILRHASERPWDERKITFRSAPRTGPRLVRTGPLVARRWARVDVTALVAASGVASFALLPGGRDRVEIASREAGRRTGPRLAVHSAIAPLPGPRDPPLRPAPSEPPSPSPPAPSPPPAPEMPTGTCAGTPPPMAWEHVVWIVLENKAYTRIMGSTDAPFLNGLAARCGWATQFFAEARPSLPNYIAMTSGDTQGITDNDGPASHPLAVQSIFSQLGTGGWRALQESMPAPCSASSATGYAARHNPATYYTNLAVDCPAQDVALGDPPDLSARFTFITPNLCHAMHDCGVAAGDAWLAEIVPKIVDSPQYRAGTTALFITWDEDDGSADHRIPTFAVAPSVVPGGPDATSYTHYSLLRTTEEMLGLPLLGQAVTASSMRPGLHL